MSHDRHIAVTFALKWGRTPLSKLRLDALEQENGIIIEQIIGDEGRVALAVCVTKPDDICGISQEMPLDRFTWFNWENTSLTEVAERSIEDGNLTIALSFGKDGKASAMIFCGVTPSAIRFLEKTFEIQDS